MRYLVFSKGFSPFYTFTFNFIDNVEMIVFDLYKQKYTQNGIDWDNIEIDKL
jgi:hypothetical protein